MVFRVESPKNKRANFILNISKILLIAVNVGFFAWIWYRYYKNAVYIPFFAKGNWLVVAIFAGMYMSFTQLYQGFEIKVCQPAELLYSQTVAGVLTCVFAYVIAWLLIRYLPAVLPFVAQLAVIVLSGAIWSFSVPMYMRKVVPPSRTVLIYDNPDAQRNAEGILKNVPWLFHCVGSISVSDDSAEAIALIRNLKAENVMICGIRSGVRNDIVKFCVESGIEAYVRPNIGDLLINPARPMHLDNMLMMLCSRAEPSWWYRTAKRTMDIIVSIAALIIFSPLMLVLALLIKCYDGGPVFYRQIRLTKDRREFELIKFRSMQVDAEKDGIARLSCQNDARVTPVGKIIREFRLDELPQLFCILKGDMTLVGPRPERPEIAAEYEESMPEFALRLQAKAGLTGYAQVYGKYNTTPYNKLQMDLQYINSMGIVTDLKILFATIKILFMKESTEGVEDGQITAEKPPEK